MRLTFEDAVRKADGVIRDLAVELVDGERGYTCEFSSSPQEHREAYERVQANIVEGVRTGLAFYPEIGYTGA